MSPDGRALPDLRLPLLGVAAWLGALDVALLHHAPRAAAILGLGIGAVLVGLWIRGRHRTGLRHLALGLLGVALLAAGIATVRESAVQRDPLAELAHQRQWAVVTATIASDPTKVTSAYGDDVITDVLVRHVEAGGVEVAVRMRAEVIGDASWLPLRLGSRVRFEGRLAPPREDGAAAQVTIPDPSASGPDPAEVAVIGTPGIGWRAAEVVRRSIRASVAGRPAEQAALLPALVDGQDDAITPALSADFRTVGLTHLLAVSGTNLTLLVGALVALARRARVRGRWLTVVGAAGIAFFVLLARTEPSVVRAAAMGVVGLIAMTLPGTDRALRALGAAVLALILIDPGIATSIGFALSVLATAGIVLWGPLWRDALGRWMPRWLAEAIAVPMAAQLACTPIIAAISGRVSLVAVLANLLAEPAVGPATVLGLAGGVLGLVVPPLGRVIGFFAGWSCGWIIAIAHRTAALPIPDVPWSVSVPAIALLVAVSVGIAMLGPRVVRHRRWALLIAAFLLLVTCIRPPSPGWPAPGWALVVCDVGQGDGLVLSISPGRAIVVDAGPDPDAMDRCLDDLGVTTVPLLVLTHFHADHVDGIAGVLRGRTVGAIETTRLADPPGGVREVHEAAAAAGVPIRVAPYGTTRRWGPVTLEALWPEPDSPSVGPGDGSTANEASVVLVAQTHGLRLLLTGDIEPEGQAVLARTLTGLRVDVLKIPHHGSRYQDMDWLSSLHARAAIASVGKDNDYGHPASSTLDGLRRGGTRVYRTDLDGAVAVVPAASGLRIVTHPARR